MFLLDSGAFTFMSGTNSPDFDQYIIKYIDFINRHDIKYFFELDIDSIVGYEKVKEYTRRLDFITLAFYGTVPSITNMILSQYFIKFVYAALDTIPFYLLTNTKE